MGRLRALELPARGCPHARLRRRGPPQPRTRPPRPPRDLRRVPRREAPHLRAGAREGRAARLRDRRDRVLRRRCVARRATDPRPPQPGERSCGDRGRPRCGVPDDAIARGAPHVPRRPAPAGARPRAARRALDQRLEGDEHGGCTARHRCLRSPASPGPRRLAQRRGLRPLRPRPPVNVSSIYSIGAATDELAAALEPQGGPTSEPATSPRPSPTPRPTPSRETSSCSRRPARASTSSRTSRSGATRSAAWSRISPERAPEAAPVRVEPARARHGGTRSLRPRDGVQRDLGFRRARQRQPARLRRAAGRVRNHRGRAARRHLPRRPGADPHGRSHARGGRAFLCLAVLAVGARINGARRWISFGPLAFQPSELAKLALVVWTAAYLARHRPPRNLKELGRPIGLLVLVFAVLVLVEPDLGTALTILLVVGAILLVSGTRLPLLGSAYGLVFGLAAVAAWTSPYRRDRLLTFLDPWKDPTGAGLQNVQALISLGSGGVFGRGLGQGRAALLPARSAHRHDLRGDRRGARAGRSHARADGLLRLRLRGRAACHRVPRPVRKAARCRDHGARLRTGCDQHGCGDRRRAADRNPASIRLVWRVEPRRDARCGRRPP